MREISQSYNNTKSSGLNLQDIPKRQRPVLSWLEQSTASGLSGYRNLLLIWFPLVSTSSVSESTRSSRFTMPRFCRSDGWWSRSGLGGKDNWSFSVDSYPGNIPLWRVLYLLQGHFGLVQSFWSPDKFLVPHINSSVKIVTETNISSQIDVTF